MERKRRVEGDVGYSVMESVRRRIVGLQFASGLTQRQVAKRIGLGRSTYGGYLRSGRNFSISTLCRLADAFDHDLEIHFAPRSVDPGDRVRTMTSIRASICARYWRDREAGESIRSLRQEYGERALAFEALADRRQM